MGLGMHQVDVQDLEFWVHQDFFNGSQEWYWFPWPKDVDDFLGRIEVWKRAASGIEEVQS